MNEQERPAPSKRIIDRRKATSHGLAGVLGFFLGLFGSGLAPRADGPDYDLVEAVSQALDRGHDFWSKNSDANQWRDARVVLIDSETKTRCGFAGPKTGPVYCPASEHIYIDLTFLRALDGELARAYVIAHELGHHVQNMRGELENRSRVEIELEADCLAGRWVKHELDLKHVTESDVEKALALAASVGDDRLNSSPESWTHGSGGDRVAAFRRGLSGDLCRVRR